LRGQVKGKNSSIGNSSPPLFPPPSRGREQRGCCLAREECTIKSPLPWREGEGGTELLLKFLSQLSAGSTINHLYQKDFVHFEFQVPKTKEEQIRIAETLSDMDAEISALETKLDKYKQIKQGMMQNLLTGKIRLV